MRHLNDYSPSLAEGSVKTVFVPSAHHNRQSSPTITGQLASENRSSNIPLSTATQPPTVTDERAKSVITDSTSSSGQIKSPSIWSTSPNITSNSSNNPPKPGGAFGFRRWFKPSDSNKANSSSIQGSNNITANNGPGTNNGSRHASNANLNGSASNNDNNNHPLNVDSDSLNQQGDSNNAPASRSCLSSATTNWIHKVQENARSFWSPENETRRLYLTFKLMPYILAGIICYCVWIYAYVFCIAFLIRDNVQRRNGIAFITLWLFGVFIITVCWLRMSIEGPGLMRRRGTDIDPESIPRGMFPFPQNAVSVPPTLPDVFVCESDGYGRWCSVCGTVKPDRTHHSSEIGKCVTKMDHFCPWVGKVIGFANYKYFCQFILWVAIVSIFGVVTMAIYIHPYQVRHNGHVRSHFIAFFVLVGMWVIIMIPFNLRTFYFVLTNQTTIERLQRYRVHQLNILMPKEGFRIVVQAPIGSNLWDIGLWKNWKSVMSANPINWLLPLYADTKRYHGGIVFPFNPRLIDQLKEEFKRQKNGRVIRGYQSHIETIPDGLQVSPPPPAPPPFLG